MNTRNNETFFFDLSYRSAVLVPGGAAGSASSATSRPREAMGACSACRRPGRAYCVTGEEAITQVASSS